VGQTVAVSISGSMPGELLQSLIEQKKIAGVYRIPIYCWDYSKFDQYHLSAKKTGIPILDQRFRSNGSLNCHNLAFVNVGRAEFKEAVYLFCHYPGLVFKVSWDRFLRSYYEPVWMSYTQTPLIDILKYINSHWSRLFQFGLPVLMVLGALFSVLSFRKQADTAGGITFFYMMLTIFYVLFLFLFTFGDDSRYRFLVDPFFLVILGVFLTRLLAFLPVIRQKLEGSLKGHNPVKLIFVGLLMAGVVFQSTIIFLPTSIHRDEAIDERDLGGPGLNIPPFFVKDILTHSTLLPGHFRINTQYHLWPVAVAYSIFGPSRSTYRSFMFIYIMIFILSFYALARIWFGGEIANIALIFALFSSPVADYAVLWHIGGVAFPFFAIYFIETKRHKHPLAASFLLALSAYAYPTAKLVVLGYIITFALLRREECRKYAAAVRIFFLLLVPLFIIMLLCPQEVPGKLVVGIKDFVEMAKYAFWYCQCSGDIHARLGTRVVNGILSISTLVCLFVFVKKFMTTAKIQWEKYFGHVFMCVLILLLFVYIYWMPYLEPRLVVWALTAFWTLTALLLQRIGSRTVKWKYYIFILLPCLGAYIATEVPPHIKKITDPKINGLYTYGALQVIPYLLKENPKKVFVDSFWSDQMLVYSNRKLNIDKIQWNQFNSSTFPWDLNTVFMDKAYFVFRMDNPDNQMNKFFRYARQKHWRYTLKKEFVFPEHNTGVKIYEAQQDFTPTSSSPNIVYLSDVDPVRMQQSYGDVQFDRSIYSPQISVGNHVYKKGIGAHVDSSIAYNVAGFKEFQAVIGLDNRMDEYDPTSYAKARFSVFLDNRLMFDSGVMDRFMKPQHLFIPINGARELRLVVKSAGRGPDGDPLWGNEVDWADAKLIKK